MNAGRQDLKILLMSDFYPPTVGGTEQHVHGLGVKLRERKHEVVVATTGSPSFVPGHDSEPALYRFPHSFSRMGLSYSDLRYQYVPPIADPVLSKSLDKLISTFRPEVMHAHGWTMFTVARVAKSYRIPVVATLHDYGFFCPKRTLYVERSSSLCPLLKKQTLRIGHECVGCSVESYGLRAPIMPALMNFSRGLLSDIDCFIGVSTYVQEIAKRSGLSPVIRIPNFLDTKQILSNVENFNASNIGDGVLYLGTLARHKGIEVLLEAYRMLHEKAPQIQLTLIGRSVAGFDVVPRTGERILRDVKYSDLLKNLIESRFLVIPSIWPEPFGIIALEAMLFSKPLIASHIAGLDDLVKPGENGLVVRPNDPVALSKAILELYSDSDKIMKMGSQGNRYLKKNFDSDVVIPRIEKLYESVVEGKSSEKLTA
jgi:glycosyltransferase involved in cell wall biosynthesis